MELTVQLTEEIDELGERVSVETLRSAGLVKSPKDPVKLLGRGSLDKKLTLVVNKASASAIEAVKKVGGTVEEI